MKLDKLHHAAIIVSDLEKARAFYVDKLELAVALDVHREDRNDHILMLKVGDTQIELFVKSDAPARVTDPEALGLRHLAFHVADIEEAVAWLNAKGIETEPIRMDPFSGVRMTFFRDPDGLPLELHE